LFGLRRNGTNLHLHKLIKNKNHSNRWSNAILPKPTKAEDKGEYRIWLKFADATEGEVDLQEELWGEMFESLKDKDLFAKFSPHKELETVVWPNGADFAPEFLYQKLRSDYALQSKTKINAA